MKLVLTLPLVGVATATNLRNPRSLSLPMISTYQPRTDVTDQMRIDLDLQAINQYVQDGVTAYQASAARSEVSTDFNNALSVYKNGGYSKSIASVTLSTAGLPSAIKKGDLLVGTSTAKKSVVMVATADTAAGETSVQLQYQDGGCYVGGIPGPKSGSSGTGDQTWTGCLNGTGSLTIETTSESVSYQYDVETDNTNQRSIQGMTANADAKMRVSPNQPFFPDFQKFYDYYGNADYGDMIVTAAFSGTATSFASGRGDLDFSIYDPKGRAEGITKGSSYIIPWMYLVREMEIGLSGCQQGCQADDCEDGVSTTSVNEADEAVAFYTGSLGSKGYLMYALADQRAADFRTAGANGNLASGTSKVNLDIFQQFNQFQSNVIASKCDDAQKNKERIVQLMTVPLIQSVLRYAYIRAYEAKTSKPDDQAEGATFAASVLPLVHACNPNDAETIYQYMMTGRKDGDADGDTDVRYPDVKQTFERNYGCLGITCADVGGFYDATTQSYMQNAQPCGGDTNTSLEIGLAVGLPIAFIVIGTFLYCCLKKRRNAAAAASPRVSSNKAIDEISNTDETDKTGNDLVTTELS